MSCDKISACKYELGYLPVLQTKLSRLLSLDIFYSYLHPLVRCIAGSIIHGGSSQCSTTGITKTGAPYTHTHTHTHTYIYIYIYIYINNIAANRKGRKEGNVLFNDALNTFYLRLYGVRHMVKDHSDSEKGNPLPPHGLLFPISSKGSFICTIPQTG